MRSVLGLVVVGGVSAALVGCMSGQGQGAEGREGASLAMLDADARAAGFSFVTEDGKVAPVAPIELEGEVTLVGPGQRIPLVGAPGELLVVTGKRGTLVPHTLATEVDADGVRVSGAEPAVRALASTLHARMSGAGPWELHAPGIMASLAHQPALEGISAVEPIDLEAADQMALTARAVAQTEMVTPFSASDPRFAGFGDLGRGAPVCGDPALGTWVSVPQRFDNWHVFTLHVQPGSTPAALTGTVNAHVWSGGSADEAPSTACDGNEMDAQVVMAATGSRAPDGSVRFDAGPWDFAPGSCTGFAEGWGYFPDHFNGVVDGGAIRSVNRDGSRWDNAPVGFQRVSCE